MAEGGSWEESWPAVRGECQDGDLRLCVFHRPRRDYYWIGLQDIQGTTGGGGKLRWVRALPGGAASDSSLGCDRCIGKERPFHRCLMSKARPHHREIAALFAESCGKLGARLSTRPGLYVRWRRVETQAGISLTDADSRVDAKNICEVIQDLAPEISWPGIVGPALSLKTFPRDERRFPEIAHPVGKPHVKIDR